jgi:hypothetical protein
MRSAKTTVSQYIMNNPAISSRIRRNNEVTAVRMPASNEMPMISFQFIALPTESRSLTASSLHSVDTPVGTAHRGTPFVTASIRRQYDRPLGSLSFVEGLAVLPN